MALKGKDNTEKIWNYFKDKGLSDFAVAGIMGNMKQESGCNPKNLQSTGNKKLGMTDDEYTTAVDNGIYTNFIKDSHGYGLVQHTFWTRKQKLLEYAQSKKKSIGDLEMQLDFIYNKELCENYNYVLTDLKKATSVREASDIFLLKYEKPADQSEKAQIKRANYAQEFYDTYAIKIDLSKFTNSSLVSYSKISPNKTSPRNREIDTITIHCVVGQVTVERLGEIFAPKSKKASSNYGIGKDGKIGMYVEEQDRSWCSSNGDNDHRAITIEVASDTTAPYAVTNAAYNSLIKLVADICKRNNIKKLVWSTNKDDRVNHKNGCNMTVHRDFASKSCPGEYLYERHGDIAAQVNDILSGKKKTLYCVQLGAYSVKKNAEDFLKKVKKNVPDAFITTVNGLHKIQVGAYSVKANAEKQVEKMKKLGYKDAFITKK